MSSDHKRRGFHSQRDCPDAPGLTNYAAAKAGIHGFAKSLVLEVEEKGVTVNTISPGASCKRRGYEFFLSPKTILWILAGYTQWRAWRST